MASLFDRNVVGGICTAFQRYAQATETTRLLQIDAVSLYPSVMTAYLPVGDITEVISIRTSW